MYYYIISIFYLIYFCFASVYLLSENGYFVQFELICAFTEYLFIYCK